MRKSIGFTASLQSYPSSVFYTPHWSGTTQLLNFPPGLRVIMRMCNDPATGASACLEDGHESSPEQVRMKEHYCFCCCYCIFIVVVAVFLLLLLLLSLYCCCYCCLQLLLLLFSMFSCCKYNTWTFLNYCIYIYHAFSCSFPCGRNITML